MLDPQGNLRWLSVPSVLIVALAVACSTSPTGRQQLVIFSDTQMSQMGATAFTELKKETPVSSDGRVRGYVRCVAQAITNEVRMQGCLLYTSPSPRDQRGSRMPSSA